MRITLRAGALAAFLGLVLLANAEVTTPTAHFGFTPGEDYKLASFEQIAGYFQKLSQQSDRLHWVEFGRSSEGRPMYVAFISSPENLRRLTEYREISRKLALGQATEEEATRLAAQGKVIVWIDSGLHATEVAPSQHAPELAYRMVTGETPELRLIRDKVILMQVPVINPDGLEMVAQWYQTQRRHTARAFALALALSEVLRSRQQPRLVHAESYGNAARHPPAVSGVVPADRL
jgi:hypothetical protein